MSLFFIPIKKKKQKDRAPQITTVENGTCGRAHSNVPSHQS